MTWPNPATTILSAALVGALMLAPATPAQGGEGDCPIHGPGAHAVQTAGNDPPEGHPSVGDAGQALPPGHPPMQGMDASAPALGTLAIKAAQGTPGAEPIGAEPVTIELYREGSVVKTLRTTLDDNGVAMVEEIAFVGVVQPVVSLERNGVTFKTVGKPMAASQPDQMIRLSVYETTAEAPAWTIKMRHVLLRRAPGGVHVSEMFVVENPSGKTWIGRIPGPADTTDAKPEGEAGRVTVRLPIPGGVTGFEPGPGLEAGQAEVTDQGLVSHAPLMPGTTQFGYSYTLPPGVSGRVHLDLAPPAEVSHMMVFVPDDGTTVEVQGLMPGQPMQGKATTVRVFQANGLQPTDAASVTLGNLRAAEPAASATSPAAPAGAAGGPPAQASQLVAGLGGGALLLGAVVMIFWRGSAQKTAAA